MKMHATNSQLGSRADGKTLCGRGFFASRRSFPTGGEYQAMDRIGGIMVLSELDFIESIPSNGCCLKCIDRLGMGGVA